MTIDEILKKSADLRAEGNLAGVETFLNDCLEQAKEKEDHGVYICVGNQLIGFYRDAGIFQRAFDVSEDILLLMEEFQLNDSPFFAITLYNVATAYQAAGKDGEAASYYKQALMILKDLEGFDQEKAYIYVNLGMLSLAAEAFQLSYEELDEAAELFQKIGTADDPYYVCALTGMGEALHHLGKGEKALSAYEEALRAAENGEPDSDSVKALCLNCAVLCGILGDHDKEAAYRVRAGKTADGTVEA